MLTVRLTETACLFRGICEIRGGTEWNQCSSRAVNGFDANVSIADLVRYEGAQELLPINLEETMRPSVVDIESTFGPAPVS